MLAWKCGGGSTRLGPEGGEGMGEQAYLGDASVSAFLGSLGSHVAILGHPCYLTRRLEEQGEEKRGRKRRRKED